jgi:hypothetical protein
MPVYQEFLTQPAPAQEPEPVDPNPATELKVALPLEAIEMRLRRALEQSTSSSLFALGPDMSWSSAFKSWEHDEGVGFRWESMYVRVDGDVLLERGGHVVRYRVRPSLRQQLDQLVPLIVLAMIGLPILAFLALFALAALASGNGLLALLLAVTLGGRRCP